MDQFVELRSARVAGVTGDAEKLLASMFTYAFRRQHKHCPQRKDIRVNFRSQCIVRYDADERTWMVLDDAWIRNGIPRNVFAFACWRLRRTCQSLSAEDCREIVNDALSCAVNLQCE